MTDRGRGVPGLEQDLVVEGLPLRVVSHGNGELAQAGHQVLGHPALVLLLAAQGVLQLRTMAIVTTASTDFCRRPRTLN